MTKAEDHAASTKLTSGALPDKNDRKGSTSVFVLALMLAALAGFVDATGYIHFHHLFVSFMSGNSTQAMVAAAEGDGTAMIVVGRIILLFVLGVTTGEIVASLSPKWGRSLVLMLETALLLGASAALGFGDGATPSLLALAMGVQNAAVHKAEGISVALTYVTGTLVHVGRSLARALRGRGPWSAALPFVGLWLGLIGGGGAGALVAERSLRLALLVAIGSCVVLLLYSVVLALSGTIEEGA